MFLLEHLAFVAIAVIFNVKANLNAIEPAEQRVKREELGCCNKKLWESSKEVWESEEFCSPQEFVVRPSCNYEINYDAKREMFSYESFDSNRTSTNCYYSNYFYGCYGKPPKERKIANQASFLIKDIRANLNLSPLNLMFFVPQITWNCLFYAGNDDKPTCHNISNAEEIRKAAKCIYIYDPLTQKFRFANRTCESAQELVIWPNNNDGCFRHTNSWEYTCVGGIGTTGHIENIKKALLPLTIKFCCNYANILSTQIYTVPSECDRESWKRVNESNADCQYVLEKKSHSEPTKVLLLVISNGVQLESGISCKHIEKTVGMYHCHCPATSDRFSNDCLKSMFHAVADLYDDIIGQ